MADKTSSPTVSMEYKVDFNNGNGKRKARKQAAGRRATSPKIPRITKLLALAHHLQGLLNQGIVKDYADIARLSGLSRARVTQIMNLTLLAPEIQEEILFSKNQNPLLIKMKDRTSRGLLKSPSWKEQLKMWKKVASPYQKK